MPGNGLVQSVSRSLDIVERICRSPEGMGVTQLASQLGLAKATAHRILRGLVERGYVYQDPSTGVYGPGTKILELAGDLRGSLVPHQIVGPLVRDLNRMADEHALFATLAPDRQCMIVSNEAVTTNKSVLVGSCFGKRFPIRTDAARVAYLAQLSDYQRQAVMRNLSEQLGEKGMEELRRSLGAPLQEVYVSQDTMGKGITSVKTVVKDHTGYAVGILGLLVPTCRVTDAAVDKLAKILMGVAVRASTALGYAEGAAGG